MAGITIPNLLCVNPREIYFCAGADKPIDQPELTPRLMVGIDNTFGRQQCIRVTGRSRGG